MKKSLSDMSLQELWQLFPILLTAPQPCWPQWYQQEADYLKHLLPTIHRISHVGSTAAGTLWAKPIIDILLEIPQGTSFDEYRQLLIDGGYRLMGQSSGGLSFNKGYTEEGFAEKVFHLHLRKAGDNHELYFRDYLMAHPETAQAYEALKLQLWQLYEHDRDAYTNAKGDFIRHYTREAKALYGSRYP